MRDAKGRATGITGVQGRNAIVDAGKFLDAPNGGKANLPMDVIVASQKVMLRDLAKAGLTASGGQCRGRTCIASFSARARPACGSSARRRRPAADVAPARRRR